MVELPRLRAATPPAGSVLPASAQADGVADEGAELATSAASFRAVVHSMIGDTQDAVRDLEMAWAAATADLARAALMRAGERLEDVVRRVKEALR